MTDREFGVVRSVDVVRESRFTWRVHLRIPGGFGMTLEPPCWFEWTARRAVRRVWERERQRGQEPNVVLSLAVDVEEPILLPPA
ncbi:MAG: hypothetical protein ABW022_14780 [Actinoplanes sp.]